LCDQVCEPMVWPAAALELVDSTDEEIERLVEVRFGSFATDAFSASANQCPLRSESDQIGEMPRMTLSANNRHPPI
jgi:hypothetical protein